jgi:hypothetical protein
MTVPQDTCWLNTGFDALLVDLMDKLDLTTRHQVYAVFFAVLLVFRRRLNCRANSRVCRRIARRAFGHVRRRLGSRANRCCHLQMPPAYDAEIRVRRDHNLAPPGSVRHRDCGDTRDDPEALELIRHDAAHVMAEAVQELWPGTQVTIGPVIENGFYLRFQAQRAVHHRRPAGDREEDARDHRSATSRSPRKCGAATRPGRCFATRARPTRSS